MKRIFILLPAVLLTFSCASINSKTITAFYDHIPGDSTVFLRNIDIKPDYILTDVYEVMPNLIKSCLVKNGLTVAEMDSDNVYKLDIFLCIKQRQQEFNGFESLTLNMSLYRGNNLALYRFYTEDSEKNIDSFIRMVNLLEKNIKRFSLSVKNEK